MSDELKRHLPRWNRGQRIKNALLYFLMRGACSAAERLPLRGLLRLVGVLAPYVFRRESRRARRQLRATMPHLDATKTIRRMFVHFAQSIWELSRLGRDLPELDESARRVLDQVIAEGKGGILISGHVGNWEILVRRSPRRVIRWRPSRGRFMTLASLPGFISGAANAVSKSSGAARIPAKRFCACFAPTD
jgi:predicted LPLAT superfamily acyltransferase